MPGPLPSPLGFLGLSWGLLCQKYIYVALCDLSGAEGIYGLDDEQEDILVVVVPRESVYQSALADETGNAAPLIGL